MTAIEIWGLAAALAMDAFSVSISSGMSDRVNLKNAFKMALMFGVFQFIMPLLGNGTALLFVEYTERFSPLIAFALLSFIGIRMILEATGGDDALPSDPFRLTSLITLAFATSIDALAAGISIGAAKTPALMPSIVIGIVAMLFSFLGIHIGKLTKRLLPFPAGVLGGGILIILALKSLLEFIL